jgi:hypothetical protein
MSGNHSESTALKISIIVISVIVFFFLYTELQQTSLMCVFLGLVAEIFSVCFVQV